MAQCYEATVVFAGNCASYKIHKEAIVVWEKFVKAKPAWASKWQKGWKVKPKLIKSSKNVLSSARTKYTMVFDNKCQVTIQFDSIPSAKFTLLAAKCPTEACKDDEKAFRKALKPALLKVAKSSSKPR